MPAGRPTKYLPIFARMVAKLNQSVAHTRAEIAAFLDVSIPTVWRWEAAYPEFCNALRAQERPALERVKHALFERAVGYTYESEKIFCHEGDVTRVPILEHVPPDPGAIQFFLMNREPETWKPRKPTEDAPPPVQLIFHDPTQAPAHYGRKRQPILIEGPPASR